jgi:hypothetical protein
MLNTFVYKYDLIITIMSTTKNPPFREDFP